MPINSSELSSIAANFGVENSSITALGAGLIHQTFLASNNKQQIVLQGINNHVFNDANKLISNYQTLYSYLTKQQYFIPKPIANSIGEYLIFKNNIPWRATSFVNNAITINTIDSENAAAKVAATFGNLLVTLTALDASKLKPAIPNFHNVLWREQQLTTALKKHNNIVEAPAIKLVNELSNYTHLGKLFTSFEENFHYPDRLLHHDCKINNILFDKDSMAVICPIDFDTLMPGKFFSDFGDMVRTMVCSNDENDTDFSTLCIKETYYKTIYESYYAAVENHFTKQELSLLHCSGLLLFYMQCIRFLTDYINGNIYYPTAYKNQNLDRAMNQFLLLKQLSIFLKKTYGFKIN